MYYPTNMFVRPVSSVLPSVSWTGFSKPTTLPKLYEKLYAYVQILKGVYTQAKTTALRFQATNHAPPVRNPVIIRHNVVGTWVHPLSCPRVFSGCRV